MPLWRTSGGALAEDRVETLEAPQPQAPVVPGLAEVEAALRKAQEEAADLPLRIQREQLRKNEAIAALGRLRNRVAAGAEFDPAEEAALTTTLEAADAQIRGLQDTLNAANGAVKRVREEAARVKRKELGRRSALARAAAPGPRQPDDLPRWKPRRRVDPGARRRSRERQGRAVAPGQGFRRRDLSEALSTLS